MASTAKFLWLDIETTGLDPDNDAMIQLGVIATDAQLRELGRAEWLVSPSDPRQLEKAAQVVKDMHTKSGLWQKIQEGMAAATLPEPAEVQAELLGFIKAFWADDQKPIMAGNSIHFDRSFLAVDMPRVVQRLNYRQVDVSSLKILAKEWYGLGAPKGEPAHTALADCEASIRELSWYRANILDIGAAPDQAAKGLSISP